MFVCANRPHFSVATATNFQDTTKKTWLVGPPIRMRRPCTPDACAVGGGSSLPAKENGTNRPCVCAFAHVQNVLQSPRSKN